ncbi:MAG: glycosyltransferase family 2 protein [bacterium]
MTSYSFLIPAYNEELIIEDEILELQAFLSEEFNSYEIIVVENGSTDASPEILRRLEKQLEELNVRHLDVANYGKALETGINATSCNRTFILNIDLWDRDFIKRAREELDDFDLIIGTKRHPDSKDQRSLFRHFLTWGLNFLLTILVGFEGTDTHGLKAFRKDSLLPIIRKIKLTRGMFDTEMVIRTQKEGKSIKEIPIELEVDRAPRNWMIQKIFQNLVDITKLTWIIHQEYSTGKRQETTES